MTPPSVPMIVARLVATLELSLVVGQAGWASAFLAGESQCRPHHAVGAILTLVTCLVGALVYIVLRQWVGRVNLVLAVTMAVLAGVQYALGEAAAVAAHIFLGVLVAMTATALTSWTYRHEPTPSPSRQVSTPSA
ncbi:hypothetical protein [Mobilicoccus pelagius]|uniref:Integral membrane protein n=1 Tax=Mobilicoccus pelagius NBRC 104925 TaxID=1089455 RepID=H5URZ8_9MICO|nr:hypothetical protein [Mobilicoccus pelagius]GAB48506.1 hypothetical protein MOPEL_073_01470 [Mobilicoccus pelagius NBRC 104925]